MASTTSSSQRRLRERALVLATRELFDQRGTLDAPVEEIARAVGIARGLIYRHFSSKEELYVLTVTDYLEELGRLLDAATEGAAAPAVALERCMQAYAGFCQRYPAFLDAQLALMHRPARELYETLSESVWLRLGQGMGRCLDVVASVLRRGEEAGVFATTDPDYMANVLWTQMLGTMHLARIRVGVRLVAPGVPALFTVEPAEIVSTCVRSAMATVGAQPA